MNKNNDLLKIDIDSEQQSNQIGRDDKRFHINIFNTNRKHDFFEE